MHVANRWLIVALAAAGTPAAAQDREVQITRTHVAGGVYMLQGSGGNIGLSIGPDGAFLIDDQFAPLTPQILASVSEVTKRPVRFVVNTHWHFDHTGGNENLGEAGAIIVAHENVRRRMSTEQFMEALDRRVPASPEAALPVVTFADAMTFHWNGDEIRVVHVAPAHTDGDSFVHFRKANVIHAGDVYFNGAYPFIDVSSDGSLQGTIEAVSLILKAADEDTKIIPGHGPLSDVASLRDYHRMLIAVNGRIRRLVDDGRSRKEVIDARPTADFDEAWGGGFMSPDRFVGIAYDGIMRRR